MYIQTSTNKIHSHAHQHTESNRRCRTEIWLTQRNIWVLLTSQPRPRLSSCVYQARVLQTSPKLWCICNLSVATNLIVGWQPSSTRCQLAEWVSRPYEKLWMVNFKHYLFPGSPHKWIKKSTWTAFLCCNLSDKKLGRAWEWGYHYR